MKDSSWKVLLSLLLRVVFSLWMAAPLFSLTLSSPCATALLALALHLLHAASHAPYLRLPYFQLRTVHVYSDTRHNSLKTHYNPRKVEFPKI